MTGLNESSSREPALNTDEKWWRAAFGVFSISLTHQEITERLDLQPTRTHAKGDPRGARRMDGSVITSIVWKDSAWHLNCPLKEDKPLDQHIRWLLDVVEPKASAIRAISKECTLIRFFCGFSSGNGQGGFTLDPKTLGRISNLGIDLVLDLYPPCRDEEFEEREFT